MKLSPNCMEEKIKILNTNKENLEKKGSKIISPHMSTPKSPNGYNDKILINQTVDSKNTPTKSVYIESYGCQMNFSDSEIIASILTKEGFQITSEIRQADLILLNTCSIREKAEQTIHHRLDHIHGLKKRKPKLLVGILGCMAERLKTKLLNERKTVDLVVGPDAYRDLPKLIHQADRGETAVNTLLSREETYADIAPVRVNANGVTAFISIMRGCDNMCSFCIVPFTRGRERSRDPYSIIEEAKNLFEQGYREITLLGQNVDSYKWTPEENNKIRIKKREGNNIITFANVLRKTAEIHPDLRIRFATSHPRDITDDVLHTMAEYENICKHIHLPVQSGNNRILKLMNRGYTREWYSEKVQRIRDIMGSDVSISSDIIAGFCTETEAEHQDTLDLMDWVEYDFSYMFVYSERPGTPAAKKLTDNIPYPVKKERLKQIIQKQNELSRKRNQRDVGRRFKILIEGPSKRSNDYVQGRNSANKVVVVPRQDKTKGEYKDVLITGYTGGTLLGENIPTNS